MPLEAFSDRLIVEFSSLLLYYHNLHFFTIALLFLILASFLLRAGCSQWASCMEVIRQQSFLWLLETALPALIVMLLLDLKIAA